MAKRFQTELGTLEILILLMLLREGEASGTWIFKAFKAKGVHIFVGTIGTTLDRLENRGVVVSSWSDPLPVCGGRRQRIYMHTARGLRMLRHMVDTIHALAMDVEGKL